MFCAFFSAHLIIFIIQNFKFLTNTKLVRIQVNSYDVNQKKKKKRDLSIDYVLFLFKIIKAAITPGTQPQRVNKKTIIIDPQPLPITASGGKIIAKITLKMLILKSIFLKTVNSLPFC